MQARAFKKVVCKNSKTQALIKQTIGAILSSASNNTS